jgi:hypothetical protein
MTLWQRRTLQHSSACHQSIVQCLFYTGDAYAPAQNNKQQGKLGSHTKIHTGTARGQEVERWE